MAVVAVVAGMAVVAGITEPLPWLTQRFRGSTKRVRTGKLKSGAALLRQGAIIGGSVLKLARNRRTAKQKIFTGSFQNTFWSLEKLWGDGRRRLLKILPDLNRRPQRERRCPGLCFPN